MKQKLTLSVDKELIDLGRKININFSMAMEYAIIDILGYRKAGYHLEYSLKLVKDFNKVKEGEE